MKVNLERIIGVQSNVIDGIVSEWVAESNNTKDPIYISDLLLQADVAEPLLARLRQEKSRKYRLLVLCDRWGNVPMPRDVVQRRHKRSLYIKPGVPMPARQQRALHHSGQWDAEMHEYEDFTVDDKGCISVTAEDAEHFISHFGVHGKSGHPISFHPNETSGDPAPCPGGGMCDVHYWRFKEQDNHMYVKLPPRRSKDPEEKKQSKGDRK